MNCVGIRKICCNWMHTFRSLDYDSLLNYRVLWISVILNDLRSVYTFSLCAGEKLKANPYIFTNQLPLILLS